QYFSLLSWLIILLYNGQNGRKTKYSYLFYLYYPLHLALLYFIRMFIYP
ncbi:MAG: TraX family protein, partial [Burkholderiales bacterium]